MNTAAKKYRVLAKVYCQQCLVNIKMKKGINTRCHTCTFLKYRNVTNLISFTSFLDRDHPDWVYFNCYEYVKGINGKWLGSYQNKGKRPVGINEL